MSSLKGLLANLRAGIRDECLGKLYRDTAAARKRAIHVAEGFQTVFGFGESAALFSGPGRTELGGNHTDHQHGHVLCASVDLDMLACAAPNGLDVIRVQSEGYPLMEVNTGELDPRINERGTSAALIRGVTAKIAELGYPVKGVDIYMVSSVLSGSGLSSSAAYEILIGTILNHFFCGGQIDAIQLAKIGQYAENTYFDKPCGLMDQMGSSIGGAVAIDFRDPDTPAVERVNYDFSQSGHAFCIVDTGASHADLTNDYAAIPKEMGAVAGYFGKNYLRDVPEAEFRDAVPALRIRCGDRAVLRALHYYTDDALAQEEAVALTAGDFTRFLSLVNASGFSSAFHLQNTWSVSNPGQQAISVALAFGRELLEGSGAIRVHGGGFAGTIQAFVPDERIRSFKAGMETLLGPDKCHILHIRPQGGCVVLNK